MRGFRSANGPADIRWNETQRLLRNRREAANAHVPPSHYNRGVQRGEQIGEVVIDLSQFAIAALQLRIDGIQFLVCGLQLLLGSLHFLVGALQFLVRGLNLLIGRAKLFDDRLEVLAGGCQFLLETCVFVLGGQGRFQRRRLRSGGRRVRRSRDIHIAAEQHQKVSRIVGQCERDYRDGDGRSLSASVLGGALSYHHRPGTFCLLNSRAEDGAQVGADAAHQVDVQRFSAETRNSVTSPR